MRHRITTRLLAAAASVVAILSVSLAEPAAARATSSASAAATAAGTCQDLALPMAMGAGAPADQTVVGTLCVPLSNPATTRVDVLVHGATYNRAYWDWPVESGTYSYVAATLRAGRATFAFDQLGAGQSSHPLSLLVTPGAEAYVLHQVIGLMRASYGFSTVDVLAHSFGSIIAVDEASTYNDADKLVVTGMLNSVGSAMATTAASVLDPADLDPQFGLLFPAGYLTSIPGTRGPTFYEPDADPAVIAYDEAHKDVVSATEVAQGVVLAEAPALLNVAAGVHIPVLVVQGQADHIFCGLTMDCSSAATILNAELPYYSSAAAFNVLAIPGAGHDLALEPSAPGTFTAMDQWIRG